VLLYIATSTAHTDYKALYEQQLHINTELVKSNEQLQINLSTLQLQIIQLQKFIFTGKQEKFKPNPNATSIQLEMFANDKLGEAVVVQETHVPAHTKKKVAVRINHQGRNPLPAHLRREVVTLEPSEDVSELSPVGEEVTETLEYKAAEVFVKQTRRPEYIKPSADGTSAKRIIASLPDNGFAKCMAGTSLLTHIAIGKYVDHLPIYRLQQIFKREKVKLDEATIYNWLKRVCNLLEPLYELHKKTVLSTRYLSADETTIAVLDEEKKGATHQGYFWAYYDTVQRLVLFEYQKGRAAKYPVELLQNYQGYLLSDGYSAYAQLSASEHIIHHCCWAHARRKFIEAQSFDDARAAAVLTHIGHLYAVERTHAQHTVQERLHARQTQSVKILSELKALLEQYASEVLPKTPINTAISYTLGLWPKLALYTTDAALRMDNNLIENSIRPIAIGRKNYLFAGSHEAAQRSAMFYSLLYTCKEYNINPAQWLQHVLDNIYNTKLSQLHKLLPQNYAAHLEQQ
jgi:transposase